MIIDFCSLNIQGLNNEQPQVKDFISVNKVSMIALIENKSAETEGEFYCLKNGFKFNWCFNYGHHPSGRIWLGWDTVLRRVHVVNASAQQISCIITKLDSNEYMAISFVYRLHTYTERRALWEELGCFSNFVGSSDIPWCFLGDFNAIPTLYEASGGNPTWDSSMVDFNDFVCSMGLTDLRSSGSLFTWWDKNLINQSSGKLTEF